MKSPEEIKNGIMEALEEVCRAVDRGDAQGVLDAANQASESLFEALDCIRHFDARVPRWISVQEQPEPPEDGEYWCYGYWIGSGRKQVETAEYLGGEWKIVNNFVLTHWMPFSLPEPPKEDAK